MSYTSTFSPLSTSSGTPTYLNALQQNQAQYKNIMAGYQNQANQVVAGYGKTNAGYNALAGQVSGLGAAQQQQQNQQYAGQRANLQQQFTSSGLGSAQMLGAAAQGVNNQAMQGQVALDDATQKNLIGVKGQQLGYQAGAQQLLSGVYGAQNQAMGASGNVSASQGGGAGYSNTIGEGGGGGSSQSFGPGGVFGGSGFAIQPMAPSGLTGGYYAGGGGYGAQPTGNYDVGGGGYSGADYGLEA